MIFGWFVSRWRLETTFQEVRAHRGVETQRQWSDLAIPRTISALLGLFLLITVLADGLARDATNVLRPKFAAWYRKSDRRSVTPLLLFAACLGTSEFLDAPAAG
jgi:hypothetical protein